MFLGKELADLATVRQLISYDFLAGCAEAWYEAGAWYHEGDGEEESLGSKKSRNQQDGFKPCQFVSTDHGECCCLAFVHIL